MDNHKSHNSETGFKTQKSSAQPGFWPQIYLVSIVPIWHRRMAIIGWLLISVLCAGALVLFLASAMVGSLPANGGAWAGLTFTVMAIAVHVTWLRSTWRAGTWLSLLNSRASAFTTLLGLNFGAWTIVFVLGLLPSSVAFGTDLGPDIPQNWQIPLWCLSLVLSGGSVAHWDAVARIALPRALAVPILAITFLAMFAVSGLGFGIDRAPWAGLVIPGAAMMVPENWPWLVLGSAFAHWLVSAAALLFATGRNPLWLGPMDA